jgi:hypothetical protein
MAAGALRALRRVGLRAPADVSVVGFDDHPMGQYFDFTTIAQDVRDQGCQVAPHMVDAAVRSGEVPPVKLHAPTRLVMRGTTAIRGTPLERAAGGYLGDDSWMFDPTDAGQLVSPVYTRSKERHSSGAHN